MSLCDWDWDFRWALEIYILIIGVTSKIRENLEVSLQESVWWQGSLSL